MVGMKKSLTLFLAVCLTCSLFSQKTLTLTRDQLKDKIKGGWAGQTIGVTFGGPYEFSYQGTYIQDYQPLLWYDGYIKHCMLDIPGLYDDLYMDLTFVDVFEKYGLDAHVDSFANAFANAGYMLWHANQAARYNILNGIKAPLSGSWQNSSHADDIDYQIESDYAGLMSPGMPNTASAISDKIGHIMNYGDGWYGGVFIGAMYSLSFASSDPGYIISEALKTVPKQSTFYQCINDVITWHKKYPSDWHQTWFEIQKKWSEDMVCSEGVFKPFNIDAKVNSAYVVLSLLYGKGDFSKTLEIATRAGQDADCNPSSAGGILGTILGYDKIPAYWKMGLKEAEDIDFKYTTISLNKVYEIGFKHALQNLQRNGARTDGDKITIALQAPAPVRLEQSFPKIYPVKSVKVNKDDLTELAFDFEGTGFLMTGEAERKGDEKTEYVFDVELYVDGQKVETAKMPTDYTTRRYELFWKFELPNGKHAVNIKVLNPDKRYSLNCSGYIVFSDKPISDPFQSQK
jgi:ADP-ribosylglycohydrolase